MALPVAGAREDDRKARVFAYRHALRRDHFGAHVAHPVRGPRPERGDEQPRERAPQEIDLRRADIEREASDDERHEREDAPLVAERLVEPDDRAEELAEEALPKAIAPRLRGRNEDVVEAREVNVDHVGTSSFWTIRASTESALVPP